MTRCAVLCTLLAMALCGCDQGAPDVERASNPAATTSIAVIPKGLSHDFWKSIHAGALKAGRELGVEILWQGPEKEDDRQQQITVVENMALRGVAGIVLAPLDDQALVRPIEEAADRDIPVVIIDSDVDTQRRVSFVATDNRRGGELAGEHLAQLLGGSGKVIMLRYQEGSASTTKREAGFLEAAGVAGLEVLSQEQYAGATKESAQSKAENLLVRFTRDGKLAVDGIFCPNESTTHGMLQALKRAGLAGAARFVGFDASQPLVAALEAGEIDALVVQNPMQMGYMGVMTIVAHLRGAAVQGRIDTGVVVVTKQGMADPAVHALLYPDLDRWLNAGG